LVSSWDRPLRFATLFFWWKKRPNLQCPPTIRILRLIMKFKFN
jgi:hypothetical protein